MASADLAMKAERPGPLSNPWPWMFSGLALAVASFMWAQTAPHTLLAGRAIIVFAGVIAAGAAVAIRPASEKVLACAATTAFVAHWGLYAGAGREAEWDSVRMVLAVAAGVALIACLIVLLPRLWRRIVVSVLIILHFGGILSAVLSAQPSPWIFVVVNVYVYRPYLEFMYLTNAYHFYAPDPGPSYILHFRIEYEQDGFLHSHWRKVPDLGEDGWPKYPLAIQYQRRLAMANLVSTTRTVDPREWVLAQSGRVSANELRYSRRLPPIPRNPDPAFQVAQYVPPNAINQILLESYVRHIVYQFLHDNPDLKIEDIKGIKVYRLEHRFLSAGQFEEGLDPQDPMTYLPYFWGDFDAKGRLRRKQDGFLYWHIPFIKVLPKQAAKLINPEFRPGPIDPQYEAMVKEAMKIDRSDPTILNYMALHAGDAAWVRYPGEVKWEVPRH
jgi:hypothetical protein